MDIYCPKCGEPWDIDSLHDTDADLSFREAQAVFRNDGCGVLFGGRPCGSTTAARQNVMAAVYDLMGDDLDGCASMFEDAETMGLL